MYKYIGKLHHIGLATGDIEQTVALYQAMGYQAGAVQLDAFQKAKICFLKQLESTTIELVCPSGGDSPVNTYLKKNGTMLYHLCYEASNIEKAVEELRADGYIPIGMKKKSLIGGRDVIFLFHTANCLIELVDCSR